MAALAVPHFSPDKFREAFERSGLSRSALARAVYGTRSTYHRSGGRTALRWYEDGIKTPTPETIEKLATALEVEASDLCEVGDE